MTSEWLITLAPIIGIVSNALLQIVFVHTTRRIGLSIMVGVVGGLLVSLSVAALNVPSGSTSAASIAVWIFALVSYLGFAYPYWVFINLHITSLRIRTLRDLLQHDGGISLSSLVAQYSIEEMLYRRLERLEHGNQIALDNGTYRLVSGKLMILHNTLGLLRAIILPASVRKN